jgi:hypothetical protein
MSGEAAVCCCGSVSIDMLERSGRDSRLPMSRYSFPLSLEDSSEPSDREVFDEPFEIKYTKQPIPITARSTQKGVHGQISFNASSPKTASTRTTVGTDLEPESAGEPWCSVASDMRSNVKMTGPPT